MVDIIPHLMGDSNVNERIFDFKFRAFELLNKAEI